MQHDRPTNAKDRPHRPRLCVHMEERQEDQIHRVGIGTDVVGTNSGPPKGVGMSMNDRLRARRRSRGEHDSHREHRLGGTRNEFLDVSKEIIKRKKTRNRLLGRCGLARVVCRDSDPLELRTTRCNNSGVLRLRDRCNRLRVINEICEFRSDRTRIRRDAGGANGCARVPGQHHLGTVVRVDDDLVALLDAIALEACSQAAHLFPELGVRPCLNLAVARFPNEHRVIWTPLRQTRQKPRHVLSSHLKRRDNIGVHCSPPLEICPDTGQAFTSWPTSAGQVERPSPGAKNSTNSLVP